MGDLPISPPTNDPRWITVRPPTTDRIIEGAITQYIRDDQGDLVDIESMTRQMPEIAETAYVVYKHGHDPTRGVVPLGPICAWGRFDDKIYIRTCVSKGNEIVDDIWNAEIRPLGTRAGFSIGGAIRKEDKVCWHEHGRQLCNVNKVIVCEVSWTPRPANKGARISYVSTAKADVEPEDDLFVPRYKRMEKGNPKYPSSSLGVQNPSNSGVLQHKPSANVEKVEDGKKVEEENKQLPGPAAAIGAEAQDSAASRVLSRSPGYHDASYLRSMDMELTSEQIMEISAKTGEHIESVQKIAPAIVAALISAAGSMGSAAIGGGSGGQRMAGEKEKEAKCGRCGGKKDKCGCKALDQTAVTGKDIITGRTPSGSISEKESLEKQILSTYQHIEVPVDAGVAVAGCGHCDDYMTLLVREGMSVAQAQLKLQNVLDRATKAKETQVITMSEDEDKKKKLPPERDGEEMQKRTKALEDAVATLSKQLGELLEKMKKESAGFAPASIGTGSPPLQGVPASAPQEAFNDCMTTTKETFAKTKEEAVLKLVKEGFQIVGYQKGTPDNVPSKDSRAPAGIDKTQKTTESQDPIIKNIKGWATRKV